MKRTKFLIMASLLTAALAASLIGSVKAATLTLTWSGYVFLGTDSFYKASVVAFQENTQAVLFVSVRNDFASRPINISAVGVNFDWGVKYNSTQMSQSAPIQMLGTEVRVFAVTFTVPNASVVSNQYTHAYTVYVEQVNATTGAKKVVDTSYSYSWISPNYSFAIYSTAQADAQSQAAIIGSIERNMPDLNSTSAKLSMTKAMNETGVAAMLYNMGNFADAKTHYDNALSRINSAFAAEETKGTDLEGAQLDLIRSQTNVSNGLANLWILLGVALVLFAIGYIIRGLGSLRKPSAAT